MKRKAKAPRTQRRSVGPVVLTPRDYELLTLVGLLRHASTEQIARELFPNPDRARRRLRQLFDAGLVDIAVLASNRPNLISLTRSGVEALTTERPETADRIERPEPIKLQAAAHHLLTVDARLYAAALGRKRGAPMTRWSGPQGALHCALGLETIPLVPDGLAEFATDGDHIVIAIEADCGTEALAVLGNKLDRYRTVAASGQVDALWFVVGAGRGRRESIAQLAGRAGLADWTRVLSTEHVTTRPVLELTPRGGGSRDSVPNMEAASSPSQPANQGACNQGSRHG